MNASPKTHFVLTAFLEMAAGGLTAAGAAINLFLVL